MVEKTELEMKFHNHSNERSVGNKDAFRSFLILLCIVCHFHGVNTFVIGFLLEEIGGFYHSLTELFSALQHTKLVQARDPVLVVKDHFDIYFLEHGF